MIVTRLLDTKRDSSNHRSANKGAPLTSILATLVTLVSGCTTSITPTTERDWTNQRQRMVQTQLADRGIQNQQVLDAFGRVPRHEFVPEARRRYAYDDGPLPIGHGQTISQPYMVAFMTEAINPQASQRVLEIGTGSGYQAAVLAELVSEVYTIELIPELAESARQRLERLGYGNIHVRAGDGFLGWPDAAPFDAVVVTCGAKEVPQPLFEQLKPDGTMVIPVGDNPEEQWLQVVAKRPNGERETRKLMPVRFVPLRRAGERDGR